MASQPPVGFPRTLLCRTTAEVALPADLWSSDVVGAADDQALLSLHGFPAPRSIRYGRLDWTESTSELPHLAEGSVAYAMMTTVAVDEFVDRPATGPTPGVKQLSFLRRRPELGIEEFRELYAHHRDRAGVFQPGISRYLQNVVESASPGAPDLDAVSELWFSSEADFREHYWLDEDAAAIENAEVARFLDFARTWSCIVRETVRPAITEP